MVGLIGMGWSKREVTSAPGRRNRRAFIRAQFHHIDGKSHESDSVCIDMSGVIMSVA